MLKDDTKHVLLTADQMSGIHSAFKWCGNTFIRRGHRSLYKNCGSLRRVDVSDVGYQVTRIPTEFDIRCHGFAGEADFSGVGLFFETFILLGVSQSEYALLYHTSTCPDKKVEIRRSRKENWTRADNLIGVEPDLTQAKSDSRAKPATSCEIFVFPVSMSSRFESPPLSVTGTSVPRGDNK